MRIPDNESLKGNLAMFSTVRKHELLFASRCTLVLKVKTETLEELKKKKIKNMDGLPYTSSSELFVL